MILLRNIMISCVCVMTTLFAEISVLPTQGSIGETFHFKVTLSYPQAQNTDNVFLRIYSEHNQSYDYKMQKEKEGVFTHSLALHEKGDKKAFVYGLQNYHGQIDWDREKHAVCVIDNSDVDEIMEDIAQHALENAQKNVHKKVGETHWGGETFHGRWSSFKATYCARFVRMCLGEGLKFSTAKGMYRHFKRQGVIETKGTPPAGAAVFYATRSGFGHTGIADGYGGIYSATSYKRGVKHDSSYHDRGRYLGYIEASFFKGYY